MGFSGLIISLWLSGSRPVSDVVGWVSIAEGAGWVGWVLDEAAVLEMAPMRPYWCTGRADRPGQPGKGEGDVCV